MASFNKVILAGNLTRDPEVKYTRSGTAVCEISLAINRVWFDKQSNSRKEEVTFVAVALWGRNAEVAGEYSSKGSNVLIEGRLKLEQWQDKDTGNNRQRLVVVGESYTMLGRKPGDQGGSGWRGEGSQDDYSQEGGDGDPPADPFEETPF